MFIILRIQGLKLIVTINFVSLCPSQSYATSYAVERMSRNVLYQGHSKYFRYLVSSCVCITSLSPHIHDHSGALIVQNQMGNRAQHVGLSRSIVGLLRVYSIGYDDGNTFDCDYKDYKGCSIIGMLDHRDVGS